MTYIHKPAQFGREQRMGAGASSSCPASRSGTAQDRSRLFWRCRTTPHGTGEFRHLAQKLQIGRGALARVILQPEADVPASLQRHSRHARFENASADNCDRPGKPAIADDLKISVKRGCARIETETDTGIAVEIVGPPKK